MDAAGNGALAIAPLGLTTRYRPRGRSLGRSPSRRSCGTGSQVANTAAFTAPASGALTEAQVRRFVAVQEGLHARMGTRATELQVKYKAIQDRKDAGVALTDVVGAYRDLFSVIAEAKKAQVDALNAQAFSLNEYAWVKTRFYEAAGVTATGIDFREMASRVQSGDLNACRDAARRGDAISGSTSTLTRPAPADEPGRSRRRVRTAARRCPPTPPMSASPRSTSRWSRPSRRRLPPG